MQEQNSANDLITLTSNEGKTYIIDMAKVEPITRADCAHEYIEDPDDQTDTYIAMTCLHCPQGFLKRKA